MSIWQKFLPLGRDNEEAKRGRPRKIADPDNAQVVLATGFEPKALALSTGSTAAYLTSLVSPKRAAFEEAPYDFDQIIQAIDTDSYIKQAFYKYEDLFWKSGWEIIGENDDSVGYLLQRIDYFEVAMQRSFEDFLHETVDQLLKFGNVFIARDRNEALNKFFPTKLTPPKGKDPVVGYYIIPTEKVQILRDEHNKPIAYKQSLNEGFTTGLNNDNEDEPVWMADEVIHLFLDRKPGRAFGTPFVTSVLDDVIALRQLEEDIQNLIHRELFPLYKYTVGTEEFPAEEEEIENAAATIEDMRVDGAIIIPGRHDVEVIGAEGKALDANGYLVQWKERVAVGMGLYPHHLGMTSSGGAGKGVTDRLDIALYDRIKKLQRKIAEMLRIHIFNPLLLEGDFDPYMNPLIDEVSDRCAMRFKEIDLDSQVKLENQVIQKYINNVVTLPEARMELSMPPESDEHEMMMTKQANLQTQQAHAQAVTGAATTPTQTKTATGASSVKPPNPKSIPPPPALHPAGGASNAPSKPDAVKPSTGGRANAKNNKSVANKARPANQHGRRMSPNIRHSLDATLLNEINNLFDEGDI